VCVVREQCWTARGPAHKTTTQSGWSLAVRLAPDVVWSGGASLHALRVRAGAHGARGLARRLLFAICGACDSPLKSRGLTPVATSRLRSRRRGATWPRWLLALVWSTTRFLAGFGAVSGGRELSGRDLMVRPSATTDFKGARLRPPLGRRGFLVSWCWGWVLIVAPIPSGSCSCFFQHKCMSGPTRPAYVGRPQGAGRGRGRAGGARRQHDASGGSDMDEC